MFSSTGTIWQRFCSSTLLSTTQCRGKTPAPHAYTHCADAANRAGASSAIAATGGTTTTSLSSPRAPATRRSSALTESSLCSSIQCVSEPAMTGRRSLLPDPSPTPPTPPFLSRPSPAPALWPCRRSDPSLPRGVNTRITWHCDGAVQDKVSGSAKDKEEASKKFAEISHGAALQTCRCNFADALARGDRLHRHRRSSWQAASRSLTSATPGRGACATPSARC